MIKPAFRELVCLLARLACEKYLTYEAQGEREGDARNNIGQLKANNPSNEAP